MKSSISQARIRQEIRNMAKEPISYLKAEPLEEDMYTWHFTIQGPQNTDFHEGLYHGQILLPFQYPFKPPDIIFMNKNGRFQVNTKICLTITQYHPEEWNSAWTIRTMLEAVMSLFSENVQGIGYEEGSSEVRQYLAQKSHNYRCQKCGVLKDILTPREKHQQQVKEEQKPHEKVCQEKLEYAPDNNSVDMAQGFLESKQFRKFSDQQHFRQGHKADRLNLNRQPREKEEVTSHFSKTPTKSNEKDAHQQHKKEGNQQGNSKISSRYQIIDCVDLNQKIRRNEVKWVQMLKKQKWTVIE